MTEKGRRHAKGQETEQETSSKHNSTMLDVQIEAPNFGHQLLQKTPKTGTQFTSKSNLTKYRVLNQTPLFQIAVSHLRTVGLKASNQRPYSSECSAIKWPHFRVVK